MKFEKVMNRRKANSRVIRTKERIENEACCENKVTRNREIKKFTHKKKIQ
jgi:hypothetical protein